MAKQRRFKCSKCDRRFSMAAHLGRHMSTLHASKKAKVAKKKKRRAVAKRRGPAVAASAKRPTGDGSGGRLGDMTAYRNDLSTQRTMIETQIQGIDAAVTALGASTAKLVVARRKRGKGTRTGSLKDYIGRVLRGLIRGKSVKEITAAVKKAGFKSKNKTLGNSVGVALAEMRNVVKVTRGIYRLK